MVHFKGVYQKKARAFNGVTLPRASFVLWRVTFYVQWLGTGFKDCFYFHLYLGKWSNLTIVFQMGWIHPSRFIFWKHILAPKNRLLPPILETTHPSTFLSIPYGFKDTTPERKALTSDSKSIPSLQHLKGSRELAACQHRPRLPPGISSGIWVTRRSSQAGKVMVVMFSHQVWGCWKRHPGTHPFWHPEFEWPGGSFSSFKIIFYV